MTNGRTDGRKKGSDGSEGRTVRRKRNKDRREGRKARKEGQLRQVKER
jgi:hypothetical protein